MVQFRSAVIWSCLVWAAFSASDHAGPESSREPKNTISLRLLAFSAASSREERGRATNSRAMWRRLPVPTKQTPPRGPRRARAITAQSTPSRAPSELPNRSRPASLSQPLESARCSPPPPSSLCRVWRGSCPWPARAARERGGRGRGGRAWPPWQRLGAGTRGGDADPHCGSGCGSG